MRGYSRFKIELLVCKLVSFVRTYVRRQLIIAVSPIQGLVSIYKIELLSNDVNCFFPLCLQYVHTFWKIKKVFDFLRPSFSVSYVVHPNFKFAKIISQ